MRLITASALTFALVASSVQDSTSSMLNRRFSIIVYAVNQDRVEIELKDVPEKVRTSVGDGTESGWKIYRAYLITNEDKSQYYELYVRKMEEETTLKVDKNGQVLNGE